MYYNAPEGCRHGTHKHRRCGWRAPPGSQVPSIICGKRTDGHGTRQTSKRVPVNEKFGAPRKVRYLFSGVVVTAVRSNWLRAPQDLNACDWVPSFTIGSTGSRPSTHGTRAASLSDRALSSWQALKTQPRHDAQGEFKQVLKLLVVLDSCEAAAVWLKWHAAGACGLASHPGASASHPGANTAHRSASIHRRRATVEPQHIAALRCQAHEDCVWAG